MLDSGRDPEHGRALAPANGNGRPVAFGVELVGRGYSVRAAAIIADVPRSTLSDHARRASQRA
jgi:hypothetical protein